MISINDVNRTFSIFYNGQTNYGTFFYEHVEEGGKVRGESKLVYSVPTPVLFQKHLGGEQSIGLSPIGADGLCAWGAIDIDRYAGHDISSIVRAIYDFQMPLIPCYSKSKKLHLFAFFETAIKPSDVRNYLTEYVNMFDCDPKTEIFPKQTEFSSTTKGTSNWINLPFFGSQRQMIDRDMSEIPIEAAIGKMESFKWSIEAHRRFIASLPYFDAPPCIQKGAILRDFTNESHCRNNFLFSASVYWRMKDEQEDIEAKLLELNSSFLEPIDEGRLRSTVFVSLKKKSYFYLCKDMPGCDRPRCRKTEYGIESKHTTGLDFGQIEQWLDDPPYYTWMVNGQKMIFYSESDILNQNRFREQAYRYLHIMPRKVKDEMWAKIINRATQDRIVHDAPLTEGGFSKGSQFFSHTISFFQDRRLAEDVSQLKLGRTFYDKNREVYIFSAYVYLKYLREVKDFRVYTDMEIEIKLKELGAYKEGQYWVIPVSKVMPNFKSQDDSVKIDFRDKEEDDPERKY